MGTPRPTTRLRLQNHDGTGLKAPADGGRPFGRRPGPDAAGGPGATEEPLNNRPWSIPSARAKRAIHAPAEAMPRRGRARVPTSPGRRTDDADHTRSGRLSSVISVADSCQLRNSWARAPTKVVPSCDKRWVGARNLRSTDHRIGTPLPQGRFRKEREPPEVKHSSRGRTRNQ